ncbi:MAG: ABC transporter permease [Anaerolineaceae bacterium]|nr:ABC transporter permease [Anaerolineaceae bacterium]
MHKYIVKRLLLTIPVLIGAAFLVFTIMSLTPGDPGTLILGMTADKADIATLNAEFGYDQPFLIRFINYLKDIVFHFDFGVSYRTRTPVFTEIMSRFPNTFYLAVSSMILSALLGVSLGILSAVMQYSVLDNIFTMLAMFFAAIPGFWLGLMLMLLFSLKLGWLPSNGVDTWRHFVLPTITLSMGGAAGLLRLTRSTMLETIRQDYIRTARSKGASEKTVIWKHALKNALLPVITSLGMNFGASLGGAIIIEMVFGMPGLGTYIVTSIRQKDVPAVLASTLLLATLFCLIMLAVDIFYAFIDPRIKAKYAKQGG